MPTSAPAPSTSTPPAPPLSSARYKLPEGLDAARWQRFTPTEQRCISAKIGKLKDEGREQQQAVAIAISMCAPGKARKSSAASAAATAQPEVPAGGEYASDQNEDGTWNVRDVPIFAEHERFGHEFDSEWLGRAVEAAAARQAEGYLAPLHVHHHGDAVVERAGFVRPTRVAAGVVAGRKRAVLHADFLRVPDAVYARIKARELPYVSVEIASVSKAEITSAALLDHEAPYFQFPLITVGTERRAALAACAPALVYRADGGAVALYRHQEDAMPATQHYAEHDEALETARAAAVEAAKAVTDKLGALGGAIDKMLSDLGITPKEAPEEEAPAEDLEAPEDEQPVEMGSAAARLVGMGAKHAAGAQSLAVRVAELEGQLAAGERTRDLERRVAGALRQLSAYGYGDEHRSDLERHAREGGGAALAAYVAAVKTAGTLAPPDDLEADLVASAADEPEVVVYQAQGPDALARARTLAAQYRSAAPALRGSFGLAQWLESNMSDLSTVVAGIRTAARNGAAARR